MASYRIAISFSGSDREFVRKVDQCLLQHFDATEVFYDERYEALMARPSLDEWLEELYGEQADLVVCFISKEYNQSVWCIAEQRAVAMAFRKEGQRRAPMLFTRGEINLSAGFDKGWAIRIEEKSPEAVAKSIVQRYVNEYPSVLLRTPDIRQRRVGIELAIILSVLTAAVGANWYFDQRAGEDYPGMLGLLLALAVFAWAMFRSIAKLFSRRSTIEYSKDPGDTEGSGDDSLEAWKNYAKQLELFHQSERSRFMRLLKRMRQARLLLMNSLVFSVVLAIGHCVLELTLRHKFNGLFLERPPGASATGFQWSFGQIIEVYQGHFALLGLYLFLTAIFAFWVGNRLRGRWNIALMVGACPAFYLGVFYLLFVVSKNYAGYFGNGRNADGFFHEVGNYYVLERLVLVPMCCFIVALLAAEFGKIARRT